MTSFINLLENEMMEFISGKEHDATLINLKKSEEFCINSRGQKIHVRSYLPSSEPQALLIFSHGYSAHINRPVYPIIGRELNNDNIGFITFDFHGHGYSEGLKALVQNYRDLIDDYLCVLQALYNNDSNNKSHLLRNGFKCPFFLFGQSMGGTVSMILSQQIYENSSLISSQYLGSIILCPAIDIKAPPSPILFLLEYLIVPLFPETSAPSFMTNVGQPDLTWIDKTFIKYIENDGYPKNPNGLGFSDTVRFRTGYSMIKMTEYVSDNLDKMAFPFVILHDPEDKVTAVTGSKRFMIQSVTKTEDKEFIPFIDARHDLIHNVTTKVVQEIKIYITKRLEKAIQIEFVN